MRHSAPQRDPAGDGDPSRAVPSAEQIHAAQQELVWGVKDLSLKTGRNPLDPEQGALCYSHLGY